MSKYRLLYILLLVPVISLAQQKRSARQATLLSTNDTITNKSTSVAKVDAPVQWYKMFSTKRDTTYADTTLTIKKEYKFNYLRKDNFGLLSFANEAHTYNTLDFGLIKFGALPEFGFKAKHFNYLNSEDIEYYNVPTPMTDLFYKTVLEQGQILDAFVTLNTSKNLNFSIAYKGTRSLGKYINNLSSSGNFRFTTNYNTSDFRYALKAHITSQDMMNEENGGITNIIDFESGNEPFTERARLDVFYKDAESMLKGNRYFYNHQFRINKEQTTNNILLDHTIEYENKFYSFDQNTPSDRLGDAYTLNIKDKTRYNKLYNKIAAVYQNENLGQIQFFIDDFRNNYFYNRALISGDNISVSKSVSQDINTIGGQYDYYKNKIKASVIYNTSLTDHGLSHFELNGKYTLDSINYISVRYQNTNKLPDHLYNLFQSDYVAYNWQNNFKNQKINSIDGGIFTKWGYASAQLSNLNDYLYFSNDDATQNTVITTPKQYNQTINYLGLKIGKEFKFGKFALDNTVLYQEVDQENQILNVPKIVTRNTLYFTDHVFKKAMLLQTGITFQYFTKYYANEYNPLIGEFYVQEQRKIGDFPMLDFFINAKVSQARIYLKAEHFNSSFTGYKFYASPNNPYRDFVIRFGIVWNFFS